MIARNYLYLSYTLCILLLAGCADFHESEPDYHVSKYKGTYLCQYAYEEDGPQSRKVQDSVYFVMTDSGATTNCLLYYTQQVTVDSFFPTGFIRSIKWDNAIQCFSSIWVTDSHIFGGSTNIRFQGDSIYFTWRTAMPLERKKYLTGKKIR